MMSPARQNDVFGQLGNPLSRFPSHFGQYRIFLFLPISVKGLFRLRLNGSASLAVLGELYENRKLRLVYASSPTCLSVFLRLRDGAYYNCNALS